MSKAADDIVTAAVLVIGDEILSGRTKDRNIGWIADHCTAIGIQLREVRIVPDVEAEIVAAVERAAVPLLLRVHDRRHRSHPRRHHRRLHRQGVRRRHRRRSRVRWRCCRSTTPERGREMTPGRLRMARIPFGAELVENKVSVAPGFKLGNVITMAGVPSIMQAMLEAVTPRLRTGRKMLSVAIDLDHPEGAIAELFRAHQERYPDVAMGSYPSQRTAAGDPARAALDRPVRLEEAAGRPEGEAATAGM